METERRIFRNTFAMTVAQGVGQLLNFGFIIYFARAFGAGVLGDYSFVMAIGALFSMFVSFGANSLAVKKISQDKKCDQELLGSLMPLQIFAGLIVIVCVLVVCKVAPMSERVSSMLFLIVAYNAVVKWTDLICTRFQAREKMYFVSYTNVVRNILRVLFGFIIIWQQNDPVVVISVFPACAFVIFIWVIHVSTKKFGSIKLSMNIQTSKLLISDAWPFFSIIILGIFYERMGIILLGTMQNEVVVGYFTSAERLIVAAGILQVMFVSAISPAMLRLAKHQKKEMSILAARCLRMLFIFTLPLSTMLFLFSKEIIDFLYGSEFIHSAAVLQIVSWVLVLRGINAYLVMLSIAVDKQAGISIIKLAILIFFVVVAICFTYLMSYLGLAYAIVLSEVVMCAALYILLIKSPYTLYFFAPVWRVVIVCVTLMVVGLYLNELPIYMRLLACATTLVIGMGVSGAIKIHDIVFLNKILFGSNNRENIEKGS